MAVGEMTQEQYEEALAGLEEQVAQVTAGLTFTGYGLALLGDTLPAEMAGVL